MARLRSFTVYAVEVCLDCGWNHLIRSFRLGARTTVPHTPTPGPRDGWPDHGQRTIDAPVTAADRAGSTPAPPSRQRPDRRPGVPARSADGGDGTPRPGSGGPRCASCWHWPRVTLVLAYRRRARARTAQWTAYKQYTHVCYSDVVPLWSAEGLDAGPGALPRPRGRVPGAHRGFMEVTADRHPRRARRWSPDWSRLTGLRRADLLCCSRSAGCSRSPRTAGAAGPKTLRRRDRRPVAAAGLPRLLELGPARDGAGQRRTVGVGARPAGAGRRADRSRHRGEALPGAAAGAARPARRAHPAWCGRSLSRSPRRP